jgi:predicted Zn-dependent protease
VYFMLGEPARCEPLLAELARPPFDELWVRNGLLARQLEAQAEKHYSEGLYEEAWQETLSARKWLEQIQPRPDLELAFLEHDLANLAYALGNYADALQRFSRLAKNFEKVTGPEHQYVEIERSAVAELQVTLGQPAEGLRLFEEQVRIVDQRTPDTHDPGRDYFRARAYIGLGRAPEALALLDKLEPSQLSRGNDHKDWKQKLDAEKGRALIAIGQVGQGTRVLQQAVAEMQELHSWPGYIRWYQQELNKASQGRSTLTLTSR